LGDWAVREWGELEIAGPKSRTRDTRKIRVGVRFWGGWRRMAKTNSSDLVEVVRSEFCIGHRREAGLAFVARRRSEVGRKMEASETEKARATVLRRIPGRGAEGRGRTRRRDDEQRHTEAGEWGRRGADPAAGARPSIGLSRSLAKPS
jgi:hypothetical protein